MSVIRVILADDHALARAGIRALLAPIAGVQILAEAADGLQALDLVRALRPDLLVADISMPGLSGLDLTERVAATVPGTRTLILSMHADRAYALRALQAGAAGYLLKDAGAAEIELAIRAVARGENYLSPAVSKHVLDDYHARLAAQQNDAGQVLTARQREVLRLIAEGHSTKMIAHKLDLSVKTIETHRTQIMQRLKIHDIAGLVRYAIRHGLIPPEP